MANRSSTVPLGMLFYKFHCHKCGEKLVRSPRTRTVKPGDPDYAEHSRLGAHSHLIGDVELTEYCFKCLSCDTFAEYEEQCVLSIIQKKLGRAVLSADDIKENRETAQKTLQKRRSVYHCCLRLLTLVALLLALYFVLKANGFEIHF